MCRGGGCMCKHASVTLTRTLSCRCLLCVHADMLICYACRRQVSSLTERLQSGCDGLTRYRPSASCTGTANRSHWRTQQVKAWPPRERHSRLGAAVQCGFGSRSREPPCWCSLARDRVSSALVCHAVLCCAVLCCAMMCFVCGMQISC
jgi:hypothetical protein